MTEDRAAHGRRLGDRRLRIMLFAMLALLPAGLPTTLAQGASPGHRAPGHRAPGHRAPGHRAPGHRDLGHRARAIGHATATRHGPKTSNPFANRGMWIWVLGSSNGGNLASIISTARQYGISTLMIKSGDGSGTWSQFNRTVVSTLHAHGIRVCGWQYVYGTHPISEAFVGAAAVRAGADCLLIDAESEYEGKYVQAQTYITWLRKLIGANFPVALAGFPYMDYHPAFPYSVFLGPGGAQYNVPQMYWVDIGTTVDEAFNHTYLYNRLYRRPIFPLGQVYNSPPSRQIVRFRGLSRAYGASGVSWWDWQEATRSSWVALSRPAASLATSTATPSVATIRIGWKGDLVVWAQEHLVSAGFRVPVDGGFGPKTLAAVGAFQLAHHTTVDGVIGPATWQLLLGYSPTRVQWGAFRKGVRKASASGFSLALPVPKSARLRAKRNEIARAGGAGRPKR